MVLCSLAGGSASSGTQSMLDTRQRLTGMATSSAAMITVLFVASRTLYEPVVWNKDLRLPSVAVLSRLLIYPGSKFVAPLSGR